MKMNMPVFTAENSLYAATSYRTLHARQARIGSNRVDAQIGPGGPPHASCARSCGFCHPDLNSNDWWQECIDEACTPYTARCVPPPPPPTSEGGLGVLSDAIVTNLGHTAIQLR